MTQERNITPIELLINPKPGVEDLSDPNNWNRYQIGLAMPDHDLANWHERVIAAGISHGGYIYDLARRQANEFVEALEASGRTTAAADLRRQIAKIFG